MKKTKEKCIYITLQQNHEFQLQYSFLLISKITFSYEFEYPDRLKMLHY